MEKSMQEQKSQLTDFLEALKLVVEKTKTTGKTESIALFEAQGRILAEDISCVKPLPAFTNSAMDGYGVRVGDGGKKVIIKTSVFAGDNIDGISIEDGECIKIMTGAPVPYSIEAVVPFENATSIDEDGVVLPELLKKNANIRPKGEEANIGKILLHNGSKLTPSAIGMLASQGIFAVQVALKPKVAVISSGNEIIEPWQKAKEHQIYNSNASTLMALCSEQGCEAHYVRLLSDSYDSTVKAIKSLSGYDLIMTTGGISMGEADFIGKAFMECGFETIFRKIQLKPGKPTMFGYMGDTAVLALPGNPLSAVANFYMFAVPLIARLSGLNACWPTFVTAKNRSSFSIKTSRANLILGNYENGEFMVYGENKYGSGMLSPVVASNSFIVTGENKSEVCEGEILKVVLIGSPQTTQFNNFLN
jgi:molybdopterin molybdotransferase